MPPRGTGRAPGSFAVNFSRLVRKLQDFFTPGSRRAPAAPPRARPKLESLEDRLTPAGHSGVAVTTSTALAESLLGTGWSPSAKHIFIDAEAPSVIRAMNFNSAANYQQYTRHFHGVLRQWVAQADRAGITDDADLVAFLGRRLAAEYRLTGGLLAQEYPGLTARSYRLLMAMNLATGFYQYATAYDGSVGVSTALHVRGGDCDQIAELLSILARAEGIAAHRLILHFDYAAAPGRFVASHDVVYAGGLWLDAEINTAFAVNLHQIVQQPPAQRLSYLFANHAVFGFYNWYLQPQVRAAQLRHGLDGGILSFYYAYYFAGLGQGNSSFRLVPGA